MGSGGSRELTHEDIEQLKKTTHFTTKEIEDWYAKFHEDFPEGGIDKEAFVNMYEQMFPQGDARRFAEHVFRAYDTDGNGEIDFSEFMTTLSVSSKGSVPEKLKWAFRMYDANGDGSVSLEEVAEMITSIHRMKGDFNKEKANELAEEIFRSLDKNKDEEISEEEFVSGARASRTIIGILQGNY